MTMTQRQADHHNNSFERSGDYIQFRDPFTGEDLGARRPPHSLEIGAGLADGFDYLRSHPDICLTIYGESHGDQDSVSSAELNPLLHDSDAVFLEGVGHSAEMDHLFWNVGTINQGMSVSQNTIDTLGAYKMRQLEALAGIKKPVLFPEIPANGNEYENQLLEFNLILDELLPKSLAGDEDFALAVEINLAVSTIMREWYMLGKMGQQMAAYEQLTGERIKSPLLWIGSMHTETIPPKADSFGIWVVRHEAHSQERNTPPSPIYNGRRTNREVPFVEAARDGLARLIRH